MAMEDDPKRFQMIYLLTMVIFHSSQRVIAYILPTCNKYRGKASGCIPSANASAGGIHHK